VFLFIAVSVRSSLYFKHYFVFAGFSALSPLKEIRPFVPLLFFHAGLFFPTGIHQSGFRLNHNSQHHSLYTHDCHPAERDGSRGQLRLPVKNLLADRNHDGKEILRTAQNDIRILRLFIGRIVGFRNNQKSEIRNSLIHKPFALSIISLAN
jgi:hypothetical protein